MIANGLITSQMRRYTTLQKVNAQKTGDNLKLISCLTIKFNLLQVAQCFD